VKNFQILIASTNKGKIAELSELLAPFNYKILSLADLESKPLEPDEPFNTFLENAIHKAKYYGKMTNYICLAEDSGLCIEALDNFPGVRSKEFSIACGGIDNALQKLEIMLEGKKNRNAFFHSSISLYFPDQDKILTASGQDHGSITFPPRGRQGFSFDPIFIPTGYNETFAELGMQKKNGMSHRSKALKEIIMQLEKL